MLQSMRRQDSRTQHPIRLPARQYERGPIQIWRKSAGVLMLKGTLLLEVTGESPQDAVSGQHKRRTVARRPVKAASQVCAQDARERLQRRCRPGCTTKPDSIVQWKKTGAAALSASVSHTSQVARLVKAM
jgi:hypothetical protein